MGAIANGVQDIFAKISAIPALASSTGLTVGGHAPDPGMTKIPLPAAWVLFSEADNQNVGILLNLPPKQPNVLMQVTVMLHIAYTSQSDLISTQYPLLEAVIAAVQGTSVGTFGSARWNLHSAKLSAINPDRQIFKIIFEQFTPFY